MWLLYTSAGLFALGLALFMISAVVIYKNSFINNNAVKLIIGTWLCFLLSVLVFAVGSMSLC